MSDLKTFFEGRRRRGDLSLIFGLGATAAKNGS
jgi:hypothetical protein